MEKIAIWTTLQFGNYGDDLQAIALANQAKEMGFIPLVYKLDCNLAHYYGITSVNNIDELLCEAKICFIAGGGQLMPINPVKRLLHRAYSEWEAMFEELLHGCRKYNIPCYPVSIGGDGSTHKKLLYYGKWRRSFFESNYLKKGTVRLPGDVSVLRQFNKEADYYPDMLLCIEEYFNIPINTRNNNEKYRVGVNLKKKHIDKILLQDIINYSKEHDDIEFHFISTHLVSSGQNYQIMPVTNSKNIYLDIYETPTQMLNLLASLDVLITSMLHLGVTALAQGTPFFSYRGPSKTKSFLRSIGGDWAILNDNIDFAFLKTHVFSKQKAELINYFSSSVINKMKEDSKEHFNFSKRILIDLKKESNEMCCDF